MIRRPETYLDPQYESTSALRHNPANIIFDRNAHPHFAAWRFSADLCREHHKYTNSCFLPSDFSLNVHVRPIHEIDSIVSNCPSLEFYRHYHYSYSMESAQGYGAYMDGSSVWDPQNEYASPYIHGSSNQAPLGLFTNREIHLSDKMLGSSKEVSREGLFSGLLADDSAPTMIWSESFRLDQESPAEPNALSRDFWIGMQHLIYMVDQAIYDNNSYQ